MDEIIHIINSKGICSTCGMRDNVTDYDLIYEGNYVYSKCDKCINAENDRIKNEQPLCLSEHPRGK